MNVDYVGSVVAGACTVVGPGIANQRCGDGGASAYGGEGAIGSGRAAIGDAEGGGVVDAAAAGWGGGCSLRRGSVGSG